MSTDGEYPFGASLDDMDLEAFMNLREWLRRALEAAGADCHSSGAGLGRIDIQWRMLGMEYTLSAAPVPMNTDEQAGSRTRTAPPAADNAVIATPTAPAVLAAPVMPKPERDGNYNTGNHGSRQFPRGVD